MDKNILFLDDDKARHAKFRDACWNSEYDVTYVWSVEEAKKALLENDVYDLATFDHDLGGDVDHFCLPEGVTKCPQRKCPG